MNKLTVIICLVLLFSRCVNSDSETNVALNERVATTVLVDTLEITVPPAYLELDPFYKKYMNVNGIHVISSWRVPDSCFYAAYITVKALTDMLPAEVME
ncbi:MAG TPA: hypothetical protein VKX35_03390, partial [Fermentimonas sp.]|nr:hypothetical protein [Fermentimonas sp.]